MSVHSSKETSLLAGKLQLYDPSCMLELDQQMAQGYAILLTGAQEQSRKHKKKSSSGPSQQTVMLGFSAMTEGNVIDACFGLTSGAPSQRGSQQVKDVKNALGEASMNNDKIPRIAVMAYSTAFKVILSFKSEVSKLNFFSKCFKYAAIQKQATEALQEAFAPLHDALAESM